MCICECVCDVMNEVVVKMTDSNTEKKYDEAMTSIGSCATNVLYTLKDELNTNKSHAYDNLIKGVKRCFIVTPLSIVLTIISMFIIYCCVRFRFHYTEYSNKFADYMITVETCKQHDMITMASESLQEVCKQAVLFTRNPHRIPAFAMTATIEEMSISGLCTGACSRILGALTDSFVNYSVIVLSCIFFTLIISMVFVCRPWISYREKQLCMRQLEERMEFHARTRPMASPFDTPSRTKLNKES
jgi:hypothetical protein